MLKSIFLIGLGGAIGSIFRYGVGVLVKKYLQSDFPVATFTVNLIGSFIIGILFGILSKTDQETSLKLFLITGVCGGFTTFSAFSLENMRLIQNGNTGLALLYIASSILLGILMVGLGMHLTK